MKRSELNRIFVQIYKKRRRLTPEVVVEEAASPKHPLHDEFDWDDESAAHKHRLDRAARLIRFVKIKVVLGDGVAIVRQWHAVHAAGAGSAPKGYMPNEEIANSAVYRQAMLMQMERDWRALELRYEHLKEFWAMVGAAAKRRRQKRAG